MDILEVQAYCLAKPGTSEDMPFGPDNLVFRVAGKMFGIAALDANPLTMNLKATPDNVVAQREAHPLAILPGYHMDKKHWNTVVMQGMLPDLFLKRLIDDSYALVVASLPKKVQATLVMDEA